jgi:hypothetical protein
VTLRRCDQVPPYDRRRPGPSDSTRTLPQQFVVQITKRRITGRHSMLSTRSEHTRGQQIRRHPVWNGVHQAPCYAAPGTFQNTSSDQRRLTGGVVQTVHGSL